MYNSQQNQAQKKQTEPTSKGQNANKDAKKEKGSKDNNQQDPRNKQDLPRAKDKDCC